MNNKEYARRKHEEDLLAKNPRTIERRFIYLVNDCYLTFTPQRGDIISERFFCQIETEREYELLDETWEWAIKSRRLHISFDTEDECYNFSGLEYFWDAILNAEFYSDIWYERIYVLPEKTEESVTIKISK